MAVAERSEPRWCSWCAHYVPDYEHHTAACGGKIRAALETEAAALRGDVAALWQRLGEVIALCNPREHRSEKDQITLSHAKQLHARWSHEPER